MSSNDNLPEDVTALIEENTVQRSPPLCPEIQLWLLKDNAPLVRDSKKHIFDDSSLRPYWAFCWGGGQVLARYLLDHPEVVRNRRVIDFGSGSGIAAIAAAKAGAAEAIAIDVDPIARAALEMNARLNRVAVTPSGEGIGQIDAANWDVLLAGDVCYLLENHDWLCGLAAADKLILVGDPGRPGLARDRLEELACFDVRTVPELEHPSIKRSAVYRLRPPAA